LTSGLAEQQLHLLWQNLHAAFEVNVTRQVKMVAWATPRPELGENCSVHLLSRALEGAVLLMEAEEETI
jgi:hypothetical protein